MASAAVVITALRFNPFMHKHLQWTIPLYTHISMYTRRIHKMYLESVVIEIAINVSVIVNG